MRTYFGNFQLAAYEIQTADRQENGMDVVQRQNEIVVVVLEVITLKLSLISVQYITNEVGLVKIIMLRL